MVTRHVAGMFAWLLGSAITFSGMTTAADSLPNQLAKYDAVPGEYLVQFKENSRFTERAAASLIGTLGAVPVERIHPDLFLVRRPVDESSRVAVAAMSASSFVKFAEPNYIYKINRVPNDPKYGSLWGMSNVGQKDSQGTVGVSGVDIQAEKAWDIETGSKDTVVAVIDTGVDFSIPDLTDNAWTNLAELNGVKGVDDDKNGYIDDIHGYNFADDNGDATDDNGHGSHCSGTIGGRGDDGAGVAGVSWNVSIMAVKFLDRKGGGSLSNAVKAIDYARKNGAKIMSNSWGGGGPSETLRKAIEEARDAGILFIAAAGNDASNNDSTPSYPASYPIDNIISVAAIGNSGTLARFSNYGARSVHVAAPGLNILSTWPSAIDSSGFKTISGTSMATPHVSGVAALLLSHAPTMTYAELRERIIRSARPLTALKGKVKSAGIVDAYNALTGTLAPPDEDDPENWTQKTPFSASTAHPYASNTSQMFEASVPGAKKVSVHFTRFETEPRYDFVEFFNGNKESLGKMSGKLGEAFSPIANGEKIFFKFTSDASINAFGFDADSIQSN